MERVWTLYRVSTKGQVNVDEDIPMQRNACHKYADSKPDWEITNELYERGISGWKVKADNRDEIQQIIEGAIKKEFDILLIYFSDRLSRKKDEAPLLLEFLSKNGVSVHTVNEGELRSVEHTDSLLNYIRYWQAEGESLKNSMRVKEQLRQMNEMGVWTGGRVPFGYDLIETTERHPKKDQKLKILSINEEEANIVRIIFNLSATKGYGRHRIAAYLNERGYTIRDKKFTDNSIFRILDNTIYIGLKKYNTSSNCKTQPYNESLRIIDDETFYKSQELIRKRKNKKRQDVLPNASKVLLSGLLICGYCGQAMNTDYSYSDYKRKDGKVTRVKAYRYRCINGMNKIEDHPKMQVGAKHIDLKLENTIIDYIKRIDLTKIDKNVNGKKENEIENKNKELAILQKTLQKKLKNIHVLHEEIPKSLLGESSFAPDFINQSIQQTEKEISEIKNNINNIREEINYLEKNTKEAEDIINLLIEWEDKYKKADNDAKKIMLSEIINNVVWTKEDLEINFREKLEFIHV